MIDGSVLHSLHLCSVFSGGLLDDAVVTTMLVFVDEGGNPAMVIDSLGLSFPDLLDFGVQPRAALLCLPWSWSFWTEHELDFFDRLTAGLRIRSPEVSGGTEAKNAEDDESLPENVAEGWRNEHAERKVEEPVTSGRDTHTCCTGSERPDLSGIDPADWSQG